MASLPRQSLAPLAVTLVAAAAVIGLWQGLRIDHRTKVAQVTEAVSYATRSELARQVIEQFRAFRDLARLWSESRARPTGQRTPPSAVPPTLFEGIDIAAWTADGRPRYLTEGSSLALENRPSPEDRTGLGELFPTEPPVEPAILGPAFDADGHTMFSFVVPVRLNDVETMLIGVIDANDALDTLLLDEDPGYDIRVTCCDGLALHERNAEPPEGPEDWIVGGWIEPEPGLLWHVEHRPTPELAADLTPWAMNAVLVVGLAMAFALGAFVYQSRRADDRALAARAAEQRVTELNRNLEHEVERRTEDLNEVLSDLNTINLSVSHDLRSPLNAISLITDQLKLKSKPESKHRELLERISANVRRTASIMDRLFGFSRATSFEYTIARIDMRAMAEQVAEELAADDGDAKISVGALPPAEADPTMVQSLLTNLVGNALKHAGGRTDAEIEIGHEQRGGESIYFVRDNGPGFDPGLADELFKPMKRFGEAKKKSDGLGLGLTIVARIARRHGGRVWAAAEPGVGATFFFTLAPRSR